MATQAALIADTIVGMKRALRRERDGETLLFPRCPFFTLLFVKHFIQIIGPMSFRWLKNLHIACIQQPLSIGLA